jgi:integrase
MATTKCKLSPKVGKDGKQQILVRLTIDRHNRPQFQSKIFILGKNFDGGKISVPTKGTLNLSEVRDAEKAKIDLSTYTNRLVSICRAIEMDSQDKITKDFILDAIRIVKKFNISDTEITYKRICDELKNEQIEKEADTTEMESKTVLFLFDVYLEKKHLSYDYTKGMKVLMRILARYEGFKRAVSDKKYRLDINEITKTDIEDIRDYIRNEYTFSLKYPKIFDELLSQYPIEIEAKHKSPKLVLRGENAVIKLMKKFKAFFNWLNDNGYTQNKPFAGVKIGTELVGTPYYLTLTERNIIADYDLSNNPALERQRDIFIFQCLIGCRVGDLLRMTNNNLIEGAIEYIPHKTKDEGATANVLRVPLNGRAKALVGKYRGADKNGYLFPFISSQKYNECIKDIFTICGITRLVTVLDPKTRGEIKRPINEIASSHMARRTFIGNLYKQVKDPNLVGKLSGHVEGSKAFARYRDIDEDMKKDLVSLLE